MEAYLTCMINTLNSFIVTDLAHLVLVISVLGHRDESLCD